MKNNDNDIKMPRKSKCQTHRPNPPSNTPREYYLRSLYIPLLDNVTEDLNERFTNKKIRHL